jgi:ABC-type transport system, involved in lipoprotein release, permease component
MNAMIDQVLLAVVCGKSKEEWIAVNSLLKMAWRNLKRRRGRTILSIMAVFAGVLVIILCKGLLDGLFNSAENANINLNSGHVRIIRPEYEIKEKMHSLTYPVGESGKSYAGLIKEIRRLPGVKIATGRIRFGMMLVNGDSHETVLGIGTDLRLEEQIDHLTQYFYKREGGTALPDRLPAAGKQEILLGTKLMQDLHLKVGDKINALFSTSMASFKVATFTVTGEMASGLRQLDEDYAYIPLDQAMSLLELPDMVTEIVVFGNGTGNAVSLMSTLQRYLALDQDTRRLKLIPWNKYSEIISAWEKVKTICNLVYILILFLASFVLFNTLMMVVAERTSEIGVLSALGMTTWNIRMSFILEGLIIAVVGSSLGTLTGGSINWFVSRSGIDITKSMSMSPSEMTVLPKLYPSYSLEVLLFSFVLGIVVTVLAAYIPARRAASLKPTEALRTI